MKAKKDKKKSAWMKTFHLFKHPWNKDTPERDSPQESQLYYGRQRHKGNRTFLEANRAREFKELNQGDR